MGETRHEISRIRKTRNHPSCRAIPSGCQADAREARHPEDHPFSLVYLLPNPLYSFQPDLSFQLLDALSHFRATFELVFGSKIKLEPIYYSDCGPDHPLGFPMIPFSDVGQIPVRLTYVQQPHLPMRRTEC